MWNKPTKEQLAIIPGLYQTENIPLKDKIIHAHFFIGGSDWFIAEYDGIDTMFGFCILNNDLEMSEWGYVGFRELQRARMNGWMEVDFDLYWQPRPASRIEIICRAQRWKLPDSQAVLEIECPNCKKHLQSEYKDDIACPECRVIILQRRIQFNHPGGIRHIRLN